MHVSFPLSSSSALHHPPRLFLNATAVRHPRLSPLAAAMVRELGVVDESDKVLAHDDAFPSTQVTSSLASDVPMQPVDSSATTDSLFQTTNDRTSVARNLDVTFALNWLSSRTRGEQALLVVIVLALSRLWLSVLNWGVVLATVLGAGLGGFMVAFYLLAVPEDTRLKRASAIAKIGRYKSLHLEMVDGVPSWSDAEKLEAVDHSFGIQLDETKDGNYDKVDISPDIDPLVEDMISFTLRDFVNVPVGLASEGQHNVPLRKSLVAMAMNVSKKFSNVRLPETALLAVFGLQNSFIVHLVRRQAHGNSNYGPSIQTSYVPSILISVPIENYLQADSLSRNMSKRTPILTR